MMDATCDFRDLHDLGDLREMRGFRDLLDFTLLPLLAERGVEVLSFTVPALRTSDTALSSLTFKVWSTGIDVRAGYVSDCPGRNPDAAHGGALVGGSVHTFMHTYGVGGGLWRMTDRETLDEFDVRMFADRTMRLSCVDLYVHVSAPLDDPVALYLASKQFRDLRGVCDIHIPADAVSIMKYDLLCDEDPAVLSDDLGDVEDFDVNFDYDYDLDLDIM